MVGVRTNVLNGPYDSLNFDSFPPYFLGMFVCWISAAFGYRYSLELTHSDSKSNFFKGFIISLIIIVTVHGLGGWPSFKLYSWFFALCCTVVLGLALGVTGGNMSNPDWLGDALFKNQIKRELINQDLYLLQCDLEGNFRIFPSTKIKVSSNLSDNEIIMVAAAEPLSHFAPVRLKNIDDGILEIHPAKLEFERIYNNSNSVWMKHMKKHYDEINLGFSRIYWSILFMETIPFNPMSTSIENELQEMMFRKVKVDFKDEIIDAEIYWGSIGSEFDFQILDSEDKKSPLNIILGKHNDNFLPKEKQISERRLAEVNIAYMQFLRSFSNLVVSLMENSESSSTRQSEISRLALKSISNRYSQIIYSNREIFQKVTSESESINNVISIQFWKQIINQTMMKPGSIFIRLHDRVTPYIEKDEVISDPTVKRLLDSIISESIEQAIQSESVIIGNAINEVHESNHNNTVNRISSLLTGSCVLLLLISMFDDPERGIL